mgnify:CR=1 FL=1
MREDILGMLKNAIEHGGDPSRVAQSLINSGYELKDVKEALDYVLSTNPSLMRKTTTQINQQNPISQVQNQSSNEMLIPPKYIAPLPKLNDLKPLPSQKTNPLGKGKIIVMVAILILLIVSLIFVIFFKDELLDLLIS